MIITKYCEKYSIYLIKCIRASYDELPFDILHIIIKGCNTYCINIICSDKTYITIDNISYKYQLEVGFIPINCSRLVERPDIDLFVDNGGDLYKKFNSEWTDWGPSSVVSIYANGFPVLLLTKTGEVYRCHDNNSKVINPQKVDIPKTLMISCGFNHWGAITTKGLYMCGNNVYNQLGFDIKETPLKVPEYLDTPRKINIDNIIMVACGQVHTIILLENGDVYGSGDSFYGQLDNVQHSSPFTKINSLKDIVSIGCNRFNTIALDKYGYIHILGNYYTPIHSDIKFTKIYCGIHHTLAISENFDIYSFGQNHNGQLCIGHKNVVNSPQLVNIDSILNKYNNYIADRSNKKQQKKQQKQICNNFINSQKQTQTALIGRSLEGRKK